MSGTKTRALIILLAFVVSIPLLRHLDHKYLSGYLLSYPDRGIEFLIRNYTQSVTLISIFQTREDVPVEEEPGEKIIVPGKGLGGFSLGDSTEKVEERLQGEWKKLGYLELTIYRNTALGLSLSFYRGELRAIGTGSSRYRTREGIGIGDSKDKVLETYGEPPHFPGRWVVGGSILGKLNKQIPRLLIAAGVLALLNVFLRKKEFRKGGRLLVPSAFLTFFLIYEIPSIVNVGSMYLLGYRDIINLVQTFILIAYPAATFSGIIWGESIAHCSGWTGWKKHPIPILLGGLLLVAVIIIWRIFLAIFIRYPLFHSPWSQLYMLISYPFLLYILWYQFNCLFAKAPPVIRVQPAP